MFVGCLPPKTEKFMEIGYESKHQTLEPEINLPFLSLHRSQLQFIQHGQRGRANGAALGDPAVRMAVGEEERGAHHRIRVQASRQTGCPVLHVWCRKKTWTGKENPMSLP